MIHVLAWYRNRRDPCRKQGHRYRECGDGLLICLRCQKRGGYLR